MVQVIEQKDEEKFKMYSKVPKKKLIEMLIECNKHLNNMLSFRIKDFTNDEEIHKMD